MKYLKLQRTRGDLLSKMSEKLFAVKLSAQKLQADLLCTFV